MDTPIAVYWTLRGPDGRPLRCELVFASGVLEVRAVNGDAPRRQVVTSETDALNVASAWKALYESSGWTSLDVPPAPQTPDSQHFKIDRSQRIHSDGVVVRVYQVFGTEMFGWDHNREQPPADRPLYYSREEAETAADYAHQLAGHLCDEVCYRWRALM